MKEWNQSLLELAPRQKPSQSLLKVFDAGIKTIKDLLWVTPLRLQKRPNLTSFENIKENELFLGRAKIINIKAVPAFGRRGKGRIQLFNLDVVVKDTFSDKYIGLKWFNSYPNLKKQLSSYDEFTFLGVPTEFKGVLQFLNPQINPKAIDNTEEMLIEYPTVNSVPGNQIKKIFDYIPSSLWQKPLGMFPNNIEKELNLQPCNQAFKQIHGQGNSELPQREEAKERIIYEEFLTNQIKVMARKLKHKKLKAPLIEIQNKEKEIFLKMFPYELTPDQIKVLNHIFLDFKSGSPMMRLIQGDVGCGKTTVAIIAALTAIKSNFQVAFMCPTEALAKQHAATISNLLKDEINIALLLGSTKAKAKQKIYEELQSGSIQFILGTHSLIQDSVEFMNLGLAIIDEQHKFGVEQRQKLIKKGKGTHSLIMTATPIPRSLQLAQYGDLDISTIRTIPAGRKGVKTRIVTKENYQKYLSFLQTRLELGEQIYVVAPAIEESETLNIKNVNEIYNNYKKYFSTFNIGILHGQLKNEEKSKVMKDFEAGKVDILISTTVIEVGINVINSTVMSIYNPDRFGLSSLHQLRGRVGRGDKPGFCFLIADSSISKESLMRIRVIEKTSDGFEIAEADLQNRGQGEMFGASQSGHISSFKFGNLGEHFKVFEKVTQDIEYLKDKHPEFLNNKLIDFINDSKVSSTI